MYVLMSDSTIVALRFSYSLEFLEKKKAPKIYRGRLGGAEEIA